MKGGMKTRLALLSILAIIGLLMAGITPALGASSPRGKGVEVVLMDDQLKIYEDGKLVKEITIPEGDYIIRISGHKLVVHRLTEEEMEKLQEEHEKMVNKWIEIANKDSRIQELTNGKGIQYEELINAMSQGDEVILTVNIEGKYYKITIDLNSETVKSIEEQSAGP